MGAQGSNNMPTWNQNAYYRSTCYTGDGSGRDSYLFADPVKQHGRRAYQGNKPYQRGYGCDSAGVKSPTSGSSLLLRCSSAPALLELETIRRADEVPHLKITRHRGVHASVH